MKPRPSGRGFWIGATRAASAPRAFLHPAAARPTPPKVSPRRRTGAGLRQALLRWVPKCGAVPDAGGQEPVNNGWCHRQAVSMLTFYHAVDADLACRRDVAERSPLSSLFGRPGVWPPPNPCREAVASGGAWLMRPLRGQVHAHGLVFAVNPGAGTAALLFVALRLRLRRRNRPARQISPPLRGFLARQISRACRSSAALRPSVRRARPRAGRITPRPRWARTWINLERTSS